jgi:hypothetical protein
VQEEECSVQTCLPQEENQKGKGGGTLEPEIPHEKPFQHNCFQPQNLLQLVAENPDDFEIFGMKNLAAS